jgi:hypothetical protein
MPAPSEKPGETMLSSEDLKDLGIDGIEDPIVKKDVEDYLKQRPKLLDDIKTGSKQARDFLAEKVKEINASKQKANELINSIVQTLLQKVSGNLSALPRELQDYFKTAAKEIEGMTATNAIGASDAAQKLLAEATAASGMVSLNAEVQAKKSAATDANVQKGYGDLSVRIEADLKAAATEKDPLKRSTLLDLQALQAERSRLETTPATTPAAAAAPAEGAAAPAAATPAAEEPEPEFSMANIGPWLKYQANSLKKTLNDAMGFLKSIPVAIGGLLGIFGIKSAVGAATEDPKLQNIKKFLADKYKLTDDEFSKVKEIKLKDFLELGGKPDWMDKDRFEKLKKDLAFNKKDTDDAARPVWKFVSDKESGWKEAPAESTAGTS